MLSSAETSFLSSIGPVGYEGSRAVNLGGVHPDDIFPLDLADTHTLITREGDFLTMPHLDGGNIDLASLADKLGLPFSVRDPLTHLPVEQGGVSP